jgi:hypothetical protein
VETAYLADCERILRDEVDNVTDVLMFDWRVRPFIVTYYLHGSQGRLLIPG